MKGAKSLTLQNAALLHDITFAAASLGLLSEDNNESERRILFDDFRKKLGGLSSGLRNVTVENSSSRRHQVLTQSAHASKNDSQPIRIIVSNSCSYADRFMFLAEK